MENVEFWRRPEMGGKIDFGGGEINVKFLKIFTFISPRKFRVNVKLFW